MAVNVLLLQQSHAEFGFALPGDHSIMRLSVIIVSYTRRELLRQTVAALLPQLGCDAEILVMDQCAETAAAGDFTGISAVRYANLPFGNMVKARNQGIALSRGEIVLFVDDDVIPLPGLMDAHVAAYADPVVGGVAGRILDRGEEAGSPVADPRSFDPVGGWEFAQFDHTTAGDVMTARGCNMSFRRKLLLRLGGFDPNIEIFRDDTDMCMRVIAEGYKIRFVPGASLVHLNAPSGGTRTASTASAWSQEWQLYRQHFRHYRDTLYFLYTHFSGPARRSRVWHSYRNTVGLSRWPWRLAAKNVAFVLALIQAARLARHRRNHPCRLS